MSQEACDQVLRDGDHRRLLKGWPELFPHLPGPQTDSDAEIVLHHARTQNPRIDFKLRAWSHRWLVDHSLPSGLPDELKPKAERLYSVVVSAVFVSANSNSPALKPLAKMVQSAMSDAVLEAEADGKLLDTPFVRARIQDARRRTFKQLLGTTGVR
ncbi:MAG TPA: hypothetical protein VN640_07070 [Sphingomicrobium sp.]|nr:hypothetical protein [Sphingomicrobium sp.]